jgi:hypothetical protein
VIVRVSVAPRIAGTTPAECLDFWRHHHADVAAELPGLVSYVQNHSVLADGRPLLPGLRFDVCAELGFPDLETMDDAFVSRHYSGPALDTQRRMIDPERIALGFARRRVLSRGDPPNEPVRLLTLLRARPGITQEELETTLAGIYDDAAATAGAAHHEIMLVERDAHIGRAPAGFDAVDVLSFVDVPAAWEYATAGALIPDRELSGVVFGSERMLTRPHCVL